MAKAKEEAEIVNEELQDGSTEESNTDSLQTAEGKEVAEKATAKAGKRSAKAVKEAKADAEGIRDNYRQLSTTAKWYASSPVVWKAA